MPVQVRQIVRSKRKTLAIVVKPDGSVIVRAPLRTPQNTIREFVEKHTAWVEKKQAEISAVQPPAPKEYLPGDLLLFLGRSYPLAIVPGQTQPLILEQSFQLAESAQGRAARVFERWYRAQARRILTERVRLYATCHGLQFTKIGITAARTRWGSCSARGSLNFSWRLILAPLEAVDYVVLHELVHTVHHNHSPRFWGLVAQIMPDYKERQRWLRENGNQVLR